MHQLQYSRTVGVQTDTNKLSYAEIMGGEERICRTRNRQTFDDELRILSGRDIPRIYSQRLYLLSWIYYSPKETGYTEECSSNWE